MNGISFCEFMPATVEILNTGDPELGKEIAAVIEHIFSDRAGSWRVSIIGSQASDRWEMKIVGPNAFERSYTLEGSAGEHRPDVIRQLVAQMLSARSI